jgi:hypothetical protein
MQRQQRADHNNKHLLLRFEKGRKNFFSEEKKQKTLASLSRFSPAAYALTNKGA